MGIDSGSPLRGYASVDSHTRLYALTPWGIPVIEGEEKTVIAPKGHPVTVTLGDGLPVGDLGHPHTDAQGLPAMLVADGQAGKLLRTHGVRRKRRRVVSCATTPDSRGPAREE